MEGMLLPSKDMTSELFTSFLLMFQGYTRQQGGLTRLSLFCVYPCAQLKLRSADARRIKEEWILVIYSSGENHSFFSFE